MLIDGKAIAQDILTKVNQQTARGSRVTMTAVTCAPDFATQTYLAMKKKRAASVGISLNVVELPVDANTEQAVTCVQEVARQSDGVVVQLPLPAHLDKQTILRAVPTLKDPDGFAYGHDKHSVLPPVVGAIDEISKRYDIAWKHKRVVVLGQGTLVGKPAARYARSCGARVRVYEKHNLDASSLRTADIIISGTGQPQFITADMVQPGVVIFDAGTSEDGGVLVGDVHTGVESVASLVTPVPGGIGPITIAYLLKNVVMLAKGVNGAS